MWLIGVVPSQTEAFSQQSVEFTAPSGPNRVKNLVSGREGAGHDGHSYDRHLAQQFECLVQSGKVVHRIKNYSKVM